MYTTFYQNLNETEKTISNPIALILGKGIISGEQESHLQKMIKKITVCEEVTMAQLNTRAEIFANKHHVPNQLLDMLEQRWKEIKENKEEPLYTVYNIPKRSGGYRTIKAPRQDLKELQKIVSDTIYNYLRIEPHNSATAFIKGSGVAYNAEYHKLSNNFCKVDFSNFFPSITTRLLMDILLEIYPFTLAYSEYKDDTIKNIGRLLQLTVNIATFEGSIPQGSPLSPYLSNIVAIPFDYHITKTLQEHIEKSVLYTRYVDDLTFSSFYHIANSKEETARILKLVVSIAQERAYKAFPFVVNDDKTTVSTKYGKNRVTGIKINKDNKVSIGYKEKQQLKQNLANLIIFKKTTQATPPQAEHVIGMLAFLKAIEPSYATYMERTLQRKFKIDNYRSINEFIHS